MTIISKIPAQVLIWNSPSQIISKHTANVSPKIFCLARDPDFIRARMYGNGCCMAGLPTFHLFIDSLAAFINPQ